MDNEFETFSRKSKRSKKSKKSKSKQGSDFINMTYDLFSAINYKVAILLFILGIIIFSDVFIESFLVGINGAVDGDTPTSKGTGIQLIALTLMYIVIDLMVSGEII